MMQSFLICSSLLTASRQYFGTYINCMLSMSPVPLTVFESYCFMKSTYMHAKMSTTTIQTKSMNLGVHGGVDNLYQASGDHYNAVRQNFYFSSLSRESAINFWSQVIVGCSQLLANILDKFE